MRALARWDIWRVPAVLGDDGPTARITNADDGPWLALCSDARAYEALEEALGGRLDLYLQVRGADMLAGLEDDLAGVDFDPHTEHAIHYRRGQIPDLREMASAADVERILAGEDIPRAFEKLVRHPGYRVVVRADEKGKSQWMLAPDTQERLLLAVFTAPDTVEAFVEAEVLPRGIVPVIVTLDGRALYRRIREMWLHGIVFNPRGPVPAKAVSAQFAQVVLERTASSAG